MTPEEQAQFDQYIAVYREDYPELSPSDLIQLNDAGIFHIMAQRLVNSGMTSTRIHEVRTHPKTLERNILDDISANRKQRLASKQAGNKDETDLRELLLSLSAER